MFTDECMLNSNYENWVLDRTITAATIRIFDRNCSNENTGANSIFFILLVRMQIKLIQNDIFLSLVYVPCQKFRWSDRGVSAGVLFCTSCSTSPPSGR